MDAVEANSVERWDHIWSDPAQAQWREQVLSPVYERIVFLVPNKSSVVDLGGGVGTLALALKEGRNCHVTVVEHSQSALDQVITAGVAAEKFDLEQPLHIQARASIVVATECIEHLSEHARVRIYSMALARGSGIFSVPNNRLGPEDEAQHTRKWTAKQFLDELRHYFRDCRVEVLDGFLLGVCGELAKKPFRLSVCMPARDEAHDLGRTLASFRGVADQLVVGIDYRSADHSWAVAEQYADVVFDITDPRGPAGDVAAKVHFAHIRNRCIDKCDGDWIFMTEAHERLLTGQDELLQLDGLPDGVKVGFVKRTGQGQQWAFPWLHRRDSKIRFIRQTHNALDFPKNYLVVKLPQISTYHERHKDNAAARAKQRKVQNRIALTEDWLNNGNENSLMYLGSEWSEYKPDKAIERLQQFLAVNRNNGAQRYHARLQCSKLLAQAGRLDDAREVLIDATADDWSRCDHWFYLGDIAAMQDRYEEAIQFYGYAATRIGNPPFTQWWIDLNIYGYLTAQRLVECHAAVGNLAAALIWAERVVDLMGEDTPAEALEEARRNITRIEEAIGHANSS